MKPEFYPELLNSIEEAKALMSEISVERKEKLEVLISYVSGKMDDKQPAKLIFICTHNSRRSHLSQVWAKVASAYYGLSVDTWSGGTEATAFNPRAVTALRDEGFQINDPGGNNPHYKVSYSEDAAPMKCFSKVFDDPTNPSESFAAVMTCTDAEQNCPFVPGTEKRISLPYVDPKEADDTPQEKERYSERSFQIASEMFYVFETIASRS